MQRLLARLVNGALIVLAFAVGTTALWKTLFAGPARGPTTTYQEIQEKLEGSTVRPFTVQFPDSSIGTVPVPGPRPTLLYLMRTTCAACRVNAPAWKDLATRAQGLAHVVVLSAEDLETLTTYQAGFGVGVTAHIPEDERDRVYAEYYMNATPTVYLIGPDGRVERLWVGVFPEELPDQYLDILNAWETS